MAEAIRMMMKAHSYLRTKVIYLSNNQYAHFEFRGKKVVNSAHPNQSNQAPVEDKNSCKISIKDEDVFS